jgi:hypothetical protein
VPAAELMEVVLLALAEEITDKTLCTVTLNTENVEQFRRAIEDLYYFEFIIGTAVLGVVVMLAEMFYPLEF